MIKTSFLLLCAIVTLSTSGALAESSPASKMTTDENYVLNLSAAGKEGDNLALIVTSSQTFSATHSGFTFNGTLNQTETGAFRLDYLLETTSNGHGIIHTGSSVILRPGEPVQVIKNDEQFYNIRLDRYNASSSAKSGG